MANDFFRMNLPDLALSIEQNTENVPQDGRFHVIHNGVDLGSYPNLKRAREHFQKIKDAAGFQAPGAEPPGGAGAANKEHIERLLDAASSYWSQSHKFRSGGGRGGRGGV